VDAAIALARGNVTALYAAVEGKVDLERPLTGLIILFTSPPLSRSIIRLCNTKSLNGGYS
jgi:hypothetical protein